MSQVHREGQRLPGEAGGSAFPVPASSSGSDPTAVQMIKEHLRPDWADLHSDCGSFSSAATEGRCVCGSACVCVAFYRSEKSRGGKGLPRGDHPGRSEGRRMTDQGKVRLMRLG